MTEKGTTEKMIHKPFKILFSLVLALMMLGLLPVLAACHSNTPAAPPSSEDKSDPLSSDVDGWFFYEDHWYYFENGEMVRNAWRLDTDLEEEAWRYLDASGRAISNQTMRWIESPQGAWAYISFNENSHALDMHRNIFTSQSLFLFC